MAGAWVPTGTALVAAASVWSMGVEPLTQWINVVKLMSAVMIFCFLGPRAWGYVTVLDNISLCSKLRRVR